MSFKLANANKISLNSSKTGFFVFYLKRKIINYDIKTKFNAHKLIPNNSVKYLGVFIDDELNWKNHINFVCDKLKRAKMVPFLNYVIMSQKIFS